MHFIKIYKLNLLFIGTHFFFFDFVVYNILIKSLKKIGEVTLMCSKYQVYLVIE